MDDPVITIVYGHAHGWGDRKDAVAFFNVAYHNSEGAERQRYGNVIANLLSGESICKDEINY